MSVTLYGSSLYGSGALYGRISAGVASAQEALSRETGLKVSVTDENLNQWEQVVGGDFYATIYASTDPADSIDYVHYRCQSAACTLANGHVVRIRVGDGTQADRQIYVQEISDPDHGLASAWESWTLLYSGNHYGITIEPNGASSYDVYHTKSDGIYKNNSLLWSHPGIIYINKVIGSANAWFLQCTRKDPWDNARILENYYTPNLGVTTPTIDATNYRWNRSLVLGFIMADGQLARLQVNGMYQNPRDGAVAGDTMSVSFAPSYTDNTPGPSYWIRGVGNLWGRNEINLKSVCKLSDGYYYLWYNESHLDDTGHQIMDIYAPVMWQRSKDMIHWSEPLATGTSAWARAFETEDYVWLYGNGSVHRRTKAHSISDLSNYVPSLTMTIPRDNQAGSGEMRVCNPGGINDTVLSLEGRKIKIEVGIKGLDGLWEFIQFNDWWVQRAVREIDGSVNRIQIPFADVWGRLENPLRDTFNFIGQTVWDDWGDGKRNKIMNYFFVNDTAPVEYGTHLRSTDWACLYTGWKGHNVTAEVQFVSGTPQLFARYIDQDNFVVVEKSGGNVQVRFKNGTRSQTSSASYGGTVFKKLKLQIHWSHIHVWVDDILRIDTTITDPVAIQPGYVGFGDSSGTTWEAANFHLDDWEAPLTTEDLARTALAMADVHDVKVSSGDSRQVALTWGPQTDLPTAGAGLRQLLDTDKLQLIWRDGWIEIGKFTDPTIVKTIQDRIISTNEEQDEDRRINLAVIDGNEDSWIEIDWADSRNRDRQLIGYYDLPELLDLDAVQARAHEEIRRGTLGSSPGGKVPLYFDLWRMDVVTWVDNAGNSTDVRIEGIDIQIEQNEKPSQRMDLITSRYQPSSATTPP